MGIIKSKIFKDESLLNEFIKENYVKIISIETITEKYNTGLPLTRGGTFIADRNVLKLWYWCD